MSFLSTKSAKTSPERTAFYYDGFNMYHAIDDMRKPHLKWVNLYKLSKLLLRVRDQSLEKVVYCSAYAHYFTNTEHHLKLKRHSEYIKALKAKSVICHMGAFAKRDLYYNGKNYKARWRRREEKQTDVRIAVSILQDAALDNYDAAYVVSGDSDLVPCFEVVKSLYPEKRIITVCPPHRKHNDDLLSIADGHDKIRESQMQKSLFGAQVVAKGKTVARRPREYHPKTTSA